MAHFIGEVVNWQHDNHYALVKASHAFTKDGLVSLSQFQVDREFPPKGTAKWMNPPQTVMQNRFILFEKLPANRIGNTGNAPQFDSISKPLALIVQKPAKITCQPFPKDIIDYASIKLSESKLYLFCHEFKVYIKDKEILNYYGPFRIENGEILPPESVSTVKQYRCPGDDQLIQSQEWGFTLMHPDAYLERVGSIQLPTITGALKKLAKLYPSLQGMGSHLESLGELLSANPKGLEENEVALLAERLSVAEDINDQITRMLPILGEHAIVSGYFDSELERHKREAEEAATRRAHDQVSVLKQEASDIHKQALAEWEKLECQRDAIAQEYCSLKAEQQALLEQEREVKSLEVSLKSQGKALVDEVAFGLRMGYLMSTSGTAPVLLQSEHPWITSEEVLAIVSKHPPLARVVTAFQGRRVPLACGARSLKLLRTFARLVCGEVVRIVPIDPLTIRARDLVGTFVNGRFQPHHSGLAHLLLSSTKLEHPSIVVFEGINRAAAELVLDPILQSRDARVPLFPEEAFQPEDPWACLGGLVWPDRLLVSATLSTGASIQRIAPPMWDRLMLVDEDKWPKGEREANPTRMEVGHWDGFPHPEPIESTRDACEGFIEVVPDASWGERGVQACTARLESLGMHETFEEAKTLILGPAALCANNDIEAFENHLQDRSRRRLRDLTHYLF